MPKAASTRGREGILADTYTAPAADPPVPRPWITYQGGRPGRPECPGPNWRQPAGGAGDRRVLVYYPRRLDSPLCGRHVIKPSAVSCFRTPRSAAAFVSAGQVSPAAAGAGRRCSRCVGPAQAAAGLDRDVADAVYRRPVPAIRPDTRTLNLTARLRALDGSAAPRNTTSMAAPGEGCWQPGQVDRRGLPDRRGNLTGMFVIRWTSSAGGLNRPRCSERGGFPTRIATVRRCPGFAAELLGLQIPSPI